MSKYKKTTVIDWTGHIIGYECKQKNVKIIVCEKSEADVIIMKYHYSKKPTKNSFLSFIVYYNDKISGALQLGYGIRPKIKGEFNYDEVKEFDRMWLNDIMPKYSETIVLSLLHNYLKKGDYSLLYLRIFISANSACKVNTLFTSSIISAISALGLSAINISIADIISLSS